MRIFVTGTTSFVGAHLIPKLQADGHQLLLLTRTAGGDATRGPLPRDAAVVAGDLRQPDCWRSRIAEFQPEAAVHLAWEGIPRYDAATSIGNLLQGLNLFTALAEVGCPVVLAAGSGWEYGLSAGKKSEDMPPQPYNAFGAAKTALQWLGSEIAQEHQCRFIWTRIFYVYGPGQRSESLIPYLIRSAREGQDPQLKNPSARNDFVYVADVADAIARLVRHPEANGIYNIGSGRTTAVQEIVHHVLRTLGRPVAYGTGTARSATDAFSGSYAAIEKLTAAVGWHPTTSMAEGVAKTIAQTSSVIASAPRARGNPQAERKIRGITSSPGSSQ